VSDEFGDDEPEDAWHPDDAVPIQVDNVLRRVELLLRRKHRLTGDTVPEQLEQLTSLVRKARRRRLLGRELLRADQADEDIDYIRSRL